ncbi:unnamed protein product [Somion occarium]|uniref:WD40 repeat-like protein n=1 Tax=Somion occarium TaxID=3059160 RepID=A0ABP1CWN3_9APHY
MGRETTMYPSNDLTSINNGSTPRGEDHTKHSKRKQTILTLLDVLNELRDGELADASINQQQQRSFEDDRDVPTVDEHLQKVGADAFNKFQRRILNLDRELRNFANAARQLGSSVGILSSSFHLRERLTQILFLFRENAADLFPRKIVREGREQLVNPNYRHLKRNKRRRAPPHVVNPTVMDTLEAEDLPQQLEFFARDVTTFLECLNEFPEFTDESLNASILSLKGDLKYWASCLKAYEGQFKYPAVQRYVHDLSTEMGEHLDSITSSLSMFIEIGVPTIRFAQKHAAANLLNLSTVATFFSAVTATTMQFSFDQTGNPLADSVNGFWFTSLVFSIGAAVNSLLGLTWKQAMYRSPGHRVPWWVLIWIKRSPLVFLVLSVACFSMGLVLFAYSSHQHQITSTVTTVFSACSCFGLAAVSTWFASERWIFNRHKGKKWLADALSDTKVKLYSIPGIAWFFTQPKAAVNKLVYWGHRQSQDASDFFSDIGKKTMVIIRSVKSNLSDASDSQRSDTGSPVPQCFSPEPLSPATARTGDALLPISEVDSITQSPSVDGLDEKTVASDSGSTAGPSSQPSLAARRRWANAVKSVSVMLRSTSAATGPFNGPSSPRRQRTMSSDGTRITTNGKPLVTLPGMIKLSRVAALVPKLKSLETTQDLAAHQALVRHLQFSPNGKFLATSSWDRTSVIFKVGDPFTCHRVLAHPQGFVGQVAWSPSGTTLLTKLGRSVKLWTDDGVCKRTIERRTAIQSIAWLPAGEAFLSVEGENVTKLDLNGNVVDVYHFEKMIIHDVAVTQDCQRMLCVGSLIASAEGLQPSKSRAEKQIIAYNLERKDIENRVPVLHDVRDITLARNDLVALVSYENKAPPQLWKLDFVKVLKDNVNKETRETARLSLRHTYMPKVQVDFAGPSYFGGKNDELILCAGKAGDIHIWDRESGALLHHIRAQTLGGDLTCIAWNHAHDSFMFATGSHDGAVRIWTAPDAPSIDEPYPSRGPTNPTNTPARTPSPFDVEYRTDSPATQLGGDSQDDHNQSSLQVDRADSSGSRRTVVFS